MRLGKAFMFKIIRRADAVSGESGARCRTPANAASIVLAGAFLLLVLAFAGIGIDAAFSRTTTNSRWSLWSDIGQALGSIGAILSGVALLGAFAALSLQARQLRLQQQELTLKRQSSAREMITTLRSLHLEILKLSLEHDDLRAVWPEHGRNATREKQQIYINIVLQHHWLALRAGDSSERDMRASLSYLFTSPAFREYWSTSKSDRRLAVAEDGEEAAFTRLVDDVFDAVTREHEDSTGPATSLAAPSPDSTASLRMPNRRGRRAWARIRTWIR